MINNLESLWINDDPDRFRSDIGPKCRICKENHPAQNGVISPCPNEICIKVEELLSRIEWKPIEEVPQEYKDTFQHVLMCNRTHNKVFPVLCTWNSLREYWEYGEGFELNPTHFKLVDIFK